MWLFRVILLALSPGRFKTRTSCYMDAILCKWRWPYFLLTISFALNVGFFYVVFEKMILRQTVEIRSFRLRRFLPNEEPSELSPHTRMLRASEKRKAFLKEACQRHPKLAVLNESRVLYPYVSKKLNWVHCAVPKIATTSLREVFKALYASEDPSKRENLTSFVDSEFGFKVLIDYNQTDQRKILDQSFKTLIIRHPLHRLVSYYEDKIKAFNPPRDSGDAAPQIRWVWFHVARWFRGLSREQTFKVTPHEYNISFAEFIRFVVTWDDKRQVPNEHWLPIADICLPCTEKYKYDYIGSMDTLSKDIEYILTRTGASNINENGDDSHTGAGDFIVKKLAPQHLVSSSRRGRHGNESTEWKAVKYFSSVPEPVMQRMLRIFWKDLELFGFTWPGYQSKSTADFFDY